MVAQNPWRMSDKINVLSERKNRLEYFRYDKNALEWVKLPISLHAYASCSKLPSNMYYQGSYAAMPLYFNADFAPIEDKQRYYMKIFF